MGIDLGEDDALAEAESETVATKWTTKIAAILSRAFHSETNNFGSAALRDTGNSEGNIRTLNANGKIPQASTRIPVRDFSADEFKDYGIQGIDFVPGSLTFREVANGAIPYTAFDIKGTPTEGARVIYNFEDGTLNWDSAFGDIVGEVREFPYSSTLDGWLPCDGRSLSRTTYADLFAAISTTYGNVDDDHFNLPDLRNRIIVGFGTTDAFNKIGKIGGTETHTLIENEMPSHRHFLMKRGPRVIFPAQSNLSSSNYLLSHRIYGQRPDGTYSYDVYFLRADDSEPTIGLSSEVGENKSHNNIQPYIVQEYRIFTG